jgi:prepilin-type N-terminal cleavage/methylation domain-containing protein
VNDRGFTLVEVIVALAATAALTATLFAAIGLGFTGMHRVEAGAERLERRGHIDFVLRRQLAAAYPASDERPAERTFTGKPDIVTFLALDGATGPGFYRVWLTTEADGSLVMTRQSLAGGSLQAVERSVLARGVKQFRLDYFGRAAPSDEPAWQARWEGRRLLPDLVRVHLALADDGARRWPDTVVRLWAADRGL